MQVSVWICICVSTVCWLMGGMLGVFTYRTACSVKRSGLIAFSQWTTGLSTWCDSFAESIINILEKTDHTWQLIIILQIYWYILFAGYASSGTDIKIKCILQCAQYICILIYLFTVGSPLMSNAGLTYKKSRYQTQRLCLFSPLLVWCRCKKNCILGSWFTSCI